MPLNNSQYNAILRRYDQLRFEDNQQLEQRYEEVSKKLPRIPAIDEEIARISSHYARQAILTKNPHLSKNYKADVEALSKEKQQLLNSIGLPKDYLEMHYHCPDCQDTGYINHEKCHCFKKAVTDLLYTQSNIRQRLEKENFGTFNINYYSDERENPDDISPRENMQNILEYCFAFIENFDQAHDNLLFLGKTGVGKTFLSSCIVKELLDRSYYVICLTSFDFVRLMEEHTFSRSDENDDTDEVYEPEDLFDCDLLVIDDLGTEMNNTFVTSQFFHCIDERLARNKSTIISTNISLDMLSQCYSERIFSRIISSYKVFELTGQDIRVLKTLNPA